MVGKIRISRKGLRELDISLQIRHGNATRFSVRSECRNSANYSEIRIKDQNGVHPGPDVAFCDCDVLFGGG